MNTEAYPLPLLPLLLLLGFFCWEWERKGRFGGIYVFFVCGGGFVCFFFNSQTSCPVKYFFLQAP